MWKLAFIVVSLQIYLIKVLQKCSLSSPLPNMYMIFFLTTEFDWFWGLVAMATKTLNLRKNIKKSSPQNHKGDEAETLQKCS